MLPIRNILHATDFSECSQHAADYAANLAKDYRARLILLHVIEPPIHSPETAAVAISDGSAMRAAAEKEILRLEDKYPDVRRDHIVTDGYAAAEIVSVANDIKPDLIVLGTHGRTGLGRLVIGSIAEDVIRRAPCPVVTLKPTDISTVDYEDWIAEAMAAGERREPRHGKDAAPEVLSQAANASYAATVEHTVRTTNRWLRDVRIRLDLEHSHQALRLVRAVLHVLRDHLSVDHVASLGAQLPLLLRGILYEGWDPTPKPEKQRHSADFLNEITAQLAPEPVDHPEKAVHAVLAALAEHLTAGEVAKLQRALPHEIRELWEVRGEKPVAVS